MISGFPISATPIDAMLLSEIPSGIIGRWGPDETKEERKRRHEAGLIFQHEELPTRSEFAPDPVEHPPHEPQVWADEPARVNRAKFKQASPAYLAQVLDEDKGFDQETLIAMDAILGMLQIGWRK